MSISAVTKRMTGPVISSFSTVAASRVRPAMARRAAKFRAGKISISYLLPYLSTSPPRP